MNCSQINISFQEVDDEQTSSASSAIKKTHFVVGNPQISEQTSISSPATSRHNHVSSPVKSPISFDPLLMLNSAAVQRSVVHPSAGVMTSQQQIMTSQLKSSALKYISAFNENLSSRREHQGVVSRGGNHHGNPLQVGNSPFVFTE